MANRLKKILLLLMLVFCLMAGAGLSSSSTQGQVSSNHPLAKWKPASDYSGLRYLGSKVCAQCHAAKVAAQSATPMAKALSTVADCDILAARPRMEFRNGPYTYRITRQDQRSIYSVS